MKTTSLTAGLLLAALGLTSGCGSSQLEKPPLHPVQGSLTINGEPAVGATVVFAPANGDSGVDVRGTRPSAVVDMDGRFRVTTYQDGDGAPVGEYKLAIYWFASPTSEFDKLDNQYGDPNYTKLNVVIRDRDNQLDPIVLDKVRVIEKAPRKSRPNPDGIED